MSKIDEIKVNKLIHSMALKYNMSDQDMKDLLFSPYEFARDKIKNIDLTDINTEEELKGIKTNFIFPSFFKLVIEGYKVKNKMTRQQYIEYINNKWKK